MSLRARACVFWTASVILSSLFAAGCGESGQGSASDEEQGQAGQKQQQQSGGKSGYPETKAMVLDILHSKEGMDTLKETISSPEFKRSAAITPDDVAGAVEKVLKQGQNQSFLAEQMKDTKFAAAVVKASRSQMTDIERQLMKDPEYQKELLTLMQSPEFMKSQFTLLKSPEYRKELMKIMTEALQEPTFRLLFEDSMKEAVKQAGGGQKEKMGQEQQGKQKGGSDKEGEAGGGEEGGGGGGSGG